MSRPGIVIDTNVVVSALRSNRGASFRLLSLVDSGRFEIDLSVPLVLEYEAACMELVGKIPISDRDVRDIVDYLCRVANKRSISFLWRPFLSDPKDDMVLELAVAGQCGIIVTYNRRDFRGVEEFGIRAITPRDFLVELGALP